MMLALLLALTNEKPWLGGDSATPKPPPKWLQARRIEVPLRTKPEYVRLVLPKEVDGGPDGRYPDLRIFDDHNIETPYVLDPEPRRTPSIGVIVSDIGFVPGAYTEAFIDTGSSGVLHDALAIQPERHLL